MTYSICLNPYQVDSMRRYSVSSRVNSVKNDDAACAEEYVLETLF
jgi:putative SOS response-associated peptidase YedK